ncbi:hypothetical protein [Corynebacterium alimapuense]|uniref:DUF4352 domain-containing protein n=1 Tax=Corynebacterium alimapuense TaxID=1576874 RepID=A0A3M8K8V1_9CORY|nr:hypothetical protein [Corynebacterium alimapuense]RNE49600.1 hypothetical protein C5L39_04460 [Corynebacterium alimapuense]
MNLNRPALGVAVVSVLFLAACGTDAEESDSVNDSGETTASESMLAQGKDVDPITADSLSETVFDTGLNVEWDFQGAVNDSNGDAVATLRARNLNDQPLDPEALAEPTLSYNTGSNNFSDADLVSADDLDRIIGLDLPLGSQASTNIQYVFDVSSGNLWDAELQVGNVIWEGNLQN